MQNFIRDLRYAFRRIAGNLGFSTIAVLSLALGIGANTAIYTLVDEVLLTDPPYSDPARLYEIYPSTDGRIELNAISYPELKDIREGTEEVFQGIAATRMALVLENLPEGSRNLMTEVVSGDYFDTLGIRPVAGRFFRPEEDRVPNAHPVVVIGYRYWQSHHGGDRAAVGRTLRLAGRQYQIIGIAPPDAPAMIPGMHPDIWAPSMMSDYLERTTGTLDSRGNHGIFLKGRLEAGVTQAEAQAALDRVVAQTHIDHPDYPDEWGLKLVSTSEVGIHPFLDSVLFPAATVLLGVVGLVLLIACLNLTSFLLARATDRRREIAIRLALGARRLTLIRQLLTETVLLGIIGGGLGVLLAIALLRATSLLNPPSAFKVDFGLTPDMPVLLVTLGISVLAGVIFGLLPALQSSKADIVTTLKTESIAGAGRSRFSLRSALVIGQVAISFLLLISAGLFLRSLQEAQNADPGFGREPTAVVWFDLSEEDYDADGARRFYRRLKEQAEALPGVRSVGYVDNLALNSTSFNQEMIKVPGIDPPPGMEAHQIERVVVDAGYFDAAGVAIMRGRSFTPGSPNDNPRQAIVSQAMALRFWPDGNALGSLFKGFGDIDYQVVGIAADANVRALGEDPVPYLYLSLDQRNRFNLRVLARTAVDPHETAQQLVDLALAMDPNVMVIESKTMREHLAFQLFPFRIGGALLGLFGGLALLLACVGLYGVIRYTVAGRIREMGIRMSLGARSGQLMGLVIRHGVFLVGLGVLIGLGAAWLVTTQMEGLLFGIGAKDPLTFIGVGLLLMGVAVAASLGPALRAGRIDPVTALKSE